MTTSNAEGQWPLSPEVEASKAMGRFLDEVLAELAKARSKFPEQSLFVTLAALTEEIGELNKAFLQYNFEPQKHVTRSQIRSEAVQSVVMVLRCMFDCEAGEQRGPQADFK